MSHPHKKTPSPAKLIRGDVRMLSDGKNLYLPLFQKGKVPVYQLGNRAFGSHRKAK